MLDLLYVVITVAFFAARRRLRRRVRAAGVGAMTLDYVVGLIVTVGLLVYLTYALLRPEKF